MRDIDAVFAKLAASSFRVRFKLGPKERAYLGAKGMDVVLTHARDFVDKRLAAAEPANDGKQTPMRGHPVFIAQHATATCCRGCLEKWHGVAKGRALSENESAYVVAVLAHWLQTEAQRSSKTNE